MDCGLRATRYVTCDGEGRHPYCEECADVLIRGGESDLGPVTQPRVPDFPNELVEAAAKAFHETYERLAPDYGYKTREASAVPWEDVPADNRALMLSTVAAVVPLIQQAERDRLAGEAGENPYSRRGAWSPISFVAWRDGAACGVAAERERTREVIEGFLIALPHLATEKQRAEAADNLRAALSPERTTGE